MKKTFFLLTGIMLCQLCSAVTITATDNLNGTCLIELNTVAGEENIVGMGLEVHCFEGQITAIDITSYNPLMNIYPDAAHDLEVGEPGSYQYGDGTPIAWIGSVGEQTLPSDDFAISVGALNGENTPGATGYATVRFLLSANENVVGRIQENALRGGIVGVNGSFLDISPIQLNFTITTVPEPATVSLLALGGLVLLRKRK